MKAYLVASKFNWDETGNRPNDKYQIIAAENAAEAISKINTKNGDDWHVIAVYEQVWHI